MVDIIITSIAFVALILIYLVLSHKKYEHLKQLKILMIFVNVFFALGIIVFDFVGDKDLSYIFIVIASTVFQSALNVIDTIYE